MSRQASSHWAALPADLHLATQRLLDLRDRCHARAVCRGWRDAAAALPELWREIERRKPVLEGKPASEARLLSFLARGLPLLCRLGLEQLSVCAIYTWEEAADEAEEGEEEEQAEEIAAVIRNPATWRQLASALMASGPSLKALRLRLPGVPPDCAWVVQLSRLESLELAFPSVPLSPLMQAAAQLTRLTTFSLEVNFDMEAHHLLREPDPADPSARTAFLQSSDPLPPNLRRLSLRRCCRGHALPAQLTALAALTRLHLLDNSLGEFFQPDVEFQFPPLPQVLALDISESFYPDLPTSLSRFAGLTELRVEGDLKDVQAIALLPRLERLHLYQHKLHPPPLTLGPLTTLRHLDTSESRGFLTLTPDLPILGHLTCLEASMQSCQDALPQLLQQCTALRRLRLADDGRRLSREKRAAARAALAQLLAANPGLEVEAPFVV
ncbi:hypothetical protein ABPG75_008941 [Micractinium tetrahymenae]